MKILHLSYSDSKGGASRAAMRIHQSLLKKKINSFLQVSTYNSSEKIKKNIIRPNIVRCFLNKLKSAIESRLSNLLRQDNFVKNSISLFPTNLHKSINESDYDAIHLHWINGETISIEDIGKIKKPIVWTLHDMWAFTGSEHYTFSDRWKLGYCSSIKKNKKRFMDIDISKFVWKRKVKSWKNKLNIVGVSNWITECAYSSYLLKDFNCQTINNTLDVRFWKREDKSICKKYFNLPDDLRFIGFGSLGYKNTNLKGKDLFLSAIKNISYNKKKIALFTIGDSNSFIENEYGIKVFSIPRLEKDIEIKKFYNCLDLIVVPSRIESFGQTASEACACEVPVVCFNATGLKDIIIHKSNGWLANPYNPKKLAEGIDYILKLDTKNYNKMRLSSGAIAKKKILI